ncbi:MAG: amidohydrolase, partial [Oligoflexia bacterium]|nr:amidohydrolase [Oligoflexia bacterium]
WLVHNPRSNQGNGVGFASALTASDRVALGTDGWVSDMVAERTAAIRLGLSPALAQARLDAGGVLVAQRFGATPQPLSTGSLGDLVVRKDGAVQHVVVDGRIVVRDRALVGADIDAVRTEATRAASKLWAAMAAL